MADLLRSGVPLLRAIECVEKQTSHPGLKAILGEIHRRVEDGSTLADAMARFENVLGEMAVSMVRAGGEGGFLEEALARVAQFTETQDDLKKRTMGAIAYPAFLAVVGTVIVVVLIVFFVPKFGELFKQLREKGELPVVTEWLLNTSAFMTPLGVADLGRAGRTGLVDESLAEYRGGTLVGRPDAAAAAAGWARSSWAWRWPASAASSAPFCTTACPSSAPWRSPATPPATASWRRPSATPPRTSPPGSRWRVPWGPAANFRPSWSK